MDMNPFTIFGQWFAEAEHHEPDNHNAMTLATADDKGRPSARTVLLKEWDKDGFVFYTNLESRKGHELAQNDYVALLFYWKSLARQIRIEGRVMRVPDHQADRYFATRPRESRIGAWASRQSQAMPGGRAEFEDALRTVEQTYEGCDVPRPPFWSGFCVVPSYFEFWQEQAYRLHLRYVFRPDGKGGWRREMLYP